MRTHWDRFFIVLCLLPAALLLCSKPEPTLVLLPKPERGAAASFARIVDRESRGQIEQELGPPAGKTEMRHENMICWADFRNGIRSVWSPVWVYPDGIIVILFDNQGNVAARHLELF